MAIDRSMLKKQLDEAKANRGSGRIAFMKVAIGSQKKLRFVEFLDENGAGQIGRLFVNFQRGQDTKSQILNRSLTLGATDAPTRLRELCAENGIDFPYDRERKQYLVNAVDITANPPIMRVFAIPVTVWEGVVELMLTDQWHDLLDPKTGRACIISASKNGDFTEYKVMPDRDAWPVPPGLLKAVVDPVTAVTDPGLAKQCQMMNVTIEELFGEQAGNITDVEPIVFEQPQKTAAPPPPPPPPPPARPAAAAAAVAARAAAGGAAAPRAAAATRRPAAAPPPPPPAPEPEELPEGADDGGYVDEPDMEETQQPQADAARLPGRAPAASARPTTTRPAGGTGGAVDVGSLVRGIIGAGRK